MSKILASIAALERAADADEHGEFHNAASELRATATAARTEHAEMVEVLKDLVGCIRIDPTMDGSIRPMGIRNRDDAARALKAGYTLLSRIAPERG